MKTRTFVALTLAALVISLGVWWWYGTPEPEPVPLPPEPTAEQLAAAIQVYAEHGAEYEPRVYSEAGPTFYTFRMPRMTADADLKGLPDLPFGFGLNVSDTEVTDAGLKELGALHNLTSVYLPWRHVTDAGLKELRGLARLSLLRNYPKTWFTAWSGRGIE